MAVTGNPRKVSRYAAAAIAATTLVSAQTPTTQPTAATEQGLTYQPAHNPIRCPHLSADLVSMPTCGGKPATCIGTEDHDVILGTDGDDVIVAGPGNDVVHGSSGNDTICGGPGNDSLTGAEGEDSLYGGPGDDRLFGGVGSDYLYGGPGDFDVLWGGPGYDFLDGGPGAYDVCMLQRDMGEVNPNGCNTIYPPPGYIHQDNLDPDVLKRTEPLKLKK